MEDYSLTVLGCSSATPNSLRFPSSQIFHALGKYFLLDCGEGTQMQLRRAKVPFENINVIFISHLHGDHYYGIFGLLASLNLTGRKTPLVIYGPKGLEEIVRFHFRCEEQNLKFPLFFKELPKEPFACIEEKKNYKIYSIYLSHRIDCWGFYFAENERERNIKKAAISQYNISIEDVKSIKQGADYTLCDGTVIANTELTTDPKPAFSYAYIADTVFKPEIAEYIKNVRLMYHEATFLQNYSDLAKETFHSTARQAAECAKLANAEKLIIGHYSARYKSLDGHREEATEVFENTELASDLYSYTVNKPPYCLWQPKSL
ncbi:MAG: ribonuclease Z [Bacteroidales bacterium]|nr:ribonuclease Z [Bacteroidales bacterium]